MKVYIVVVNFHPKNSPMNYEISCEIFLNKKEALEFKKQKENEYEKLWINDYNIVKLFEKEI